MIDNSELRRLAEAAIPSEQGNTPEELIPYRRFRDTTNPARILALLDEVEALKREREWQPIETAPKDGTAILSARFWTMADGVYRLGWSATGYVDERGVWSFDSFDLDADEYNAPTHWMPLPKGPTHDQ